MNFLFNTTKNSILLTLCLAFSTSIYGQDIIPYLGNNGKYGFMAEGKKITDPVLDEAVIFPKDMQSVDAKKGGQPVAVFRNGKVVSIGSCCSKGLPVLNFKKGGTTKLDSLGHLVALIYGGNKLMLTLTDKSSTKEVRGLGPVLTPDWMEPAEAYKERNLDKECKFIHGLFKVYKDAEHINFVDTNLKEIFPQDYAQGSVADEQFIILSEGKGRFAIADHSGKVRTPFTWKQLTPSTATGYFIANGYPGGNYGRVGLIDAEGKIIIDTAFQDISRLNASNILIAKKNGPDSYIFDGSGKPLFDGKRGYAYATDDANFLVFTVEGKSEIINPAGKKIFSGSPLGVFSYSKNSLPHFILKYEDRYEVIDTTGQTLFTESSQNEIEPITTSAPRYLHFLITEKTNDRRKGIKDEKGNWVLKQEYSRIIYHSAGKVYEVTKDSMTGVFRADGKLVIAQKKQELAVIKLHPSSDSALVWVREEGKVKWIAFDTDGKRADIPDRFDPSTGDMDVVHFRRKAGSQSNEFEVALADDTVVPLPNPSGGAYLNFREEQYRTPEGGLVLMAEGGSVSRSKNVKVYNHQFKNILPAGFSVNNDRWDEVEPDDDRGLLPVYRGNECGVINALGEWVMPPKNGVRFFALSYYLVAEVPPTAKPASGVLPYPMTLHKVNQPEKTSTRVDEYPPRFIQKSSARRFVQLNPNGRAKYVLVDYKGNELFPYHLISAPELFGKSNELLTYLDENDEVQQVIVGGNGQIISHLKNHFSADYWCHGNFGQKSWSFIVIQEKTKLPPAFLDPTKRTYEHQLKEALDKLNPIQGIMDSLGNVVVPVKFKKLEIIELGKLFSTDGEEGNTQLRKWDTSLIGKLPSGKTPTRIQLENGNLLVGNDRKTFLISPANEILREYPTGLSFSSDFEKQKEFNQTYFTSKNSAGKTLWVRISDGKMFKE